MVGVSLFDNQVLLGITEGYVKEDEIKYIGCGVELYITVPKECIYEIYKNHKMLNPTNLEVQPWGDFAFEVMNEAISVMREVATWGREKGFRVWMDEWLTPEELITEDTQPENFCIGKVNGEIACAFILQKLDKEYWANATENEAVYLHKLCVRRKFAHQGMTNAVLMAIREECKKDGVKYIRLDTGLDEKVVRKIYLNAGFKIVDIIDYDNGKSLALYELEV